MADDEYIAAFDAACAHKEELEARQREAERLELLADRESLERWLDRVLDATVGRAAPEPVEWRAAA